MKCIYIEIQKNINNSKKIKLEHLNQNKNSSIKKLLKGWKSLKIYLALLDPII